MKVWEHYVQTTRLTARRPRVGLNIFKLDSSYLMERVQDKVPGLLANVRKATGPWLTLLAVHRILFLESELIGRQKVVGIFWGVMQNKTGVGSTSTRHSRKAGGRGEV